MSKKTKYYKFKKTKMMYHSTVFKTMNLFLSFPPARIDRRKANKNIVADLLIGEGYDTNSSVGFYIPLKKEVACKIPPYKLKDVLFNALNKTFFVLA